MIQNYFFMPIFQKIFKPYVSIFSMNVRIQLHFHNIVRKKNW